ncbi:MAG: hypothetical protein ACI83W_000013 [Marinoscillum sp.]|jgi:hypothetical protein
MDHLTQLPYLIPNRKLTSILLFLTVLAILFFSCTNSKKVANAGNASYIELETTSCMGPCPVYKMTVSKEQAVFIGTANVDMEGEYLTKLDGKSLELFESLMEPTKVDALETSYKSTDMLDLPTTYLRIFDGDSMKTIMKYGDQPKALEPYFNFFNTLRKDKDWKKISE